MRLATIPNGTRDGALVIVSADGARATEAGVAPNLLAAIESWTTVEPQLREIAARLESGDVPSVPFSDRAALAPLPRTWQWLDASAFDNHGRLLSRALGLEPIVSPVPLMYQGLSHEFLAPYADVPFAFAEGEIDFEAEFAVVLRETPAAIRAEEADQYIALVTVLNDWSYRKYAGEELRRGFGFLQAKPATGAAPIAITPDELGDHWRDGRVHLPLSTRLNGRRFGDVPGDQMDYSFGELIAFAAQHRTLAAGTILGSGTVSSRDYLEVGSSCIAERRGVELIHGGDIRMPWLAFGDRVEMFVEDRGRSLFGRLSQTVVERQVDRPDAPAGD